MNVVLTINAGSSSLKFALFHTAEGLERLVSGKFDRIGLHGTSLSVQGGAPYPVDAPDHVAAVPVLLEWLEKTVPIGAVDAVGHRIVHGGPYYCKPRQIDAPMLKDLRELIPVDPEHLPAEIEVVEEFGRRYPPIPQFACFDTAFHWSLPRVAKLLPIPRRYEALGVRRYGFHGLSYAYLMERLGPDGANKRIILAHLGHGASMAAVRDGQCIDTTMAFSPAAGLVMSTRSGDIDPGLPGYLARTEGMTPKEFNHMVNAESGLLGVSEISSDMRDLLRHEKADIRTAEAIELFCYHARKWIGALTAALGGVDLLVFTAGIGENSPPLRARICQGLGYLGIELDAGLNDGNAPIISRSGSKVSVRVIRTDEESYIAALVREMEAEVVHA